MLLVLHTITSSTYPLNVHADTTYHGILVNGNVCPTVNFARNNNTTPEWKLGLSGNNADNFSISTGAGSNDRLILRANSATINGSYLNVNNLMVDSKVYHSTDTDNFFQFGTDSQYFYTNNAERFKIQRSGVIITGIATVSGNIDANGDLDVDGHTNLDNISVAGVSTFTGDATFSGNVSIGGTLTYEDVTNVDSVGLLTARSGIRVTGGVIEAQAGENKIPSLYANMAALPSAGSYHGMFAHVHSTGRGYFAHAGNWLELVNKDTTGGNVGLIDDLYLHPPCYIIKFRQCKHRWCFYFL